MSTGDTQLLVKRDFFCVCEAFLWSRVNLRLTFFEGHMVVCEARLKLLRTKDENMLSWNKPTGGVVASGEHNK